MIGKNVLAALAVGTCIGLGASLSAADAAPAPSGLLSNGREVYVDFFLKARSADWIVKEVHNSNGTLPPAAGDGEQLTSTTVGVEYGRRARNSWGYAGSLSFGSVAIQPTFFGNTIGAEATGTGFGVDGLLHYSRDMFGTNAVDEMVFGYDVGGRLSLATAKLKNDKFFFQGTLSDVTLKPHFGAFGRYDTGEMTIQADFGFTIDMPFFREFKDTSPSNNAPPPGGTGIGNTGERLEAKDSLGVYLGGSFRWDRYNVSLRLEFIDEFSARFGFSLLF